MLAEQMANYAAYHRNPWNRLTHFVGVPVIVFAILIPTSWVQLPGDGFAPSLAMLLVLGVLVYYLLLDRLMGLAMVPVFSMILFFSHWVATSYPINTGLKVFGIAFVGGWAVQLLGHVFEGRRPALVDNFWQIFVAPIFLVAEVLFMLGARTDLQQDVEARIGSRGV